MTNPEQTPLQTLAVIKERCEDIFQYADVLTEWETNFLKNIIHRCEKGWPLTEKQAAMVEKIYKQALERMD